MENNKNFDNVEKILKDHTVPEARNDIISTAFNKYQSQRRQFFYVGSILFLVSGFVIFSFIKSLLFDVSV